MPINPPQFNAPNYANTMAQGTQNALAQAQLMNVGQQMQQRNALAPQVQAQSSLKTDLQRLGYMEKVLPLAQDQSSYEGVLQDLRSKGIPGVDKLPQQYDPKMIDSILQRINQKTGTTAPNSVREFQYYQNLPPEEQKTFMGLKRQSQLLNLGDRVIVNNPTGQETYKKGVPEQSTPGYRANVKAAETTAAAKSKLQQNLPQVLANAEQSINTVNDLIKSPGLPYITGMYSKAPVIPGTKQAEAKALYDQLMGQQFLSAYTTLRGGGQITEVEGKKATDAMSRMQRSVSLDAFKKAAKQYVGILQKGMERAKMMAGPANNQIQTTQVQQQAPQQAIDYLMQNNTPEMQQAFKAKYGYLP